jgi:hypothetical protein
MNVRWRIDMLGGLRAVQDDHVLTRFRTPIEQANYDLAAVRTALGEEAFAAAWAAGRAMSLEDAIALALDETPET